MANIAGWALESQLIREVLRSPEETMFWTDRPARLRRLFPGHHRALPEETRDRVLTKAKHRASIERPGRGPFYHCFGVVKRDQISRERLESFLYLYGFCRNICLALLLTIVLAIGPGSTPWRESGVGKHARWTIAATSVTAIGMFYRYLKFFREYTVEVFRSYAETDETSAPSA